MGVHLPFPENGSVGKMITISTWMDLLPSYLNLWQKITKNPAVWRLLADLGRDAYQITTYACADSFLPDTKNTRLLDECGKITRNGTLTTCFIIFDMFVCHLFVCWIRIVHQSPQENDKTRHDICATRLRSVSFKGLMFHFFRVNITDSQPVSRLNRTYDCVFQPLSPLSGN